MSVEERFEFFMNTKKTDRRAKRTKQLLRQALIKLLLEKEIKDITVIELTELADVNRGTFYLHYGNIYELYEQIEQDMLDDFAQIIQRYDLEKRQDALYPVICDAFEFLADNSDLCIAFLKHNNTTFLNRIFAASKTASLDIWRCLYGTENSELHEYCYSFLTNGCVGLLRSWFMDGMKESPKEMAQLAGKMMMGCMDSLGDDLTFQENMPSSKNNAENDKAVR